MATGETELEVLKRYLDAYRGAVRWKVHGLTREEAMRALVPSGSSLLGMLKHLAYVERWWFQDVIAGRDVDYPWADDDEAEFRIADDETIEAIVALHERECAESNEIYGSLTDPAAMVPFRDGSLAVRDILVHMVEEIARHAGHMDILREQIDGSTGGFPPDGLPWS